MQRDDVVKGKLICVEGVDGSGKSTQAHLLYEWLLGLNYKVFFSEWNSSEIVKGATKKGKKRQVLTPTTFSLIHATDFADRYERQILPMLKGGYIVICDRYIFTSFARDTIRGCNIEWLKRVYSFAIKPHIVFYYRIDVEIALKRILTSRATLKFFEAGLDLNYSQDPFESFQIFQRKIGEKYDELAKEYDFVVIDATKDIYEQQRYARSVIEERIELYRYRKRVLK